MNAALGIPVASFLVVSAAMPISIGLLRRLSVMDVPNARSSHATPVPRGAGLALALGMLVGLGAFGALEAWMLLVILVLPLLGAWDDFSPLPVRMRLVVESLVCIVIAWSIVRQSLSVEARWSILLLFAGALVLVATVNATNFMDGINGISGLHAALWGLTFAVMASRSGEPALVALALSCAAAGAAFLPWNAVRALAFLGDSGSYLIGATAGALALSLSFEVGCIPAFLPLTLYATDTLTTVIRRRALGARLGQAHREHIYQRLTQVGMSHLSVAVVVAGGSAVTCACALFAAATQSPGADLVAVLISGCVALAYYYSPVLASHLMHRRLHGLDS